MYHMDYNHVECAALSRALEIAARRQTTPEQVTIFTNAQAAIRRITSEEPGSGQIYAIQVRRHIAELRSA
jgi:ribonuclease HI